MIETVRPRELLAAQEMGSVVIDVRSPKEFAQGHIPGAINMPLFSDEERAIVGTLYKQQGKQPAVLKGLEIVGPKMRSFVETAQALQQNHGNFDILVHCWRGGMRSGSVAWLLSTAGLNVKVMRGGYKAYRNYIRFQFSSPVKLLILGGLTGSGKTEILKQLAKWGEQFLDLEGLANHKGSAFGPLGQQDQPTTEQFENDCYHIWKTFDLNRLVLVEGESPNIGKVRINDALLEKMRVADLLIVELERSIRIERILHEYGQFPVVDLIETSKKIEKKLGGQNLKEVISNLSSGDIKSATSILLDYYDRTYWHSLKKKGKQWVDHLLLQSNDVEENAKKVLDRIITYKQTLGL